MNISKKLLESITNDTHEIDSTSGNLNVTLDEVVRSAIEEFCNYETFYKNGLNLTEMPRKKRDEIATYVTRRVREANDKFLEHREQLASEQFEDYEFMERVLKAILHANEGELRVDLEDIALAEPLYIADVTEQDQPFVALTLVERTDKGEIKDYQITKEEEENGNQ